MTPKTAASPHPAINIPPGGSAEATGTVSRLSLHAVHKSFGPQTVLRDITLNVPRGQSLAVIGGSGTGKSVLLKCILGLEPVDAGIIRFDGADVTETDRAPLLSRFGMLFQGAALFDSLPIWQNVAFRLLRGPDALPKAQARTVALDKLARVGLSPEVADRFPAELSGGMRKRAGLARAIAADPEVIFFDEPTTGLDPIMGNVIDRLIRSIVDEMGVTAITITHDMSSVRAIADQVALLEEGRIRWHGAVSDMDAADDPYLRQFISGAADGPIATLR